MSPENEPRRKSGGWLVLIAALAVPGFLFYNWSRGLKADHERALSLKARARLSQGAGVFAATPAGGRLVNPIAAPAVAKPSAPKAPSAATATRAAPAAARAAPGNARGSAPTAAPSTVLISPAFHAPTVSTATQTPSVSTSSVLLERDPFVSPLDLVRIREAEAERERLRRLAWEAAHPPKKAAHHVRAVVRRIEDDVDLQGIVTSPDGSARAIVNDETLSVGDSFAAPGHEGRVTIVEITSDAVWFVYKNRRFKKIVASE